MPAALLVRLAPYGAIVLVALALFGYGYARGHAAATAHWEAVDAKRERVALEATQRMERRGAEEVVRYVTKTKVIHEQIHAPPLAVTLDDDKRCALPPGFDRVWNATNRASTAGTAGGADAAADPAVVPGAATRRRNAAAE